MRMRQVEMKGQEAIWASRSRWEPDRWETKPDVRRSERGTLQLETSWNATARWIPDKSAWTVRAQHERRTWTIRTTTTTTASRKTKNAT